MLESMPGGLCSNQFDLPMISAEGSGRRPADAAVRGLKTTLMECSDFANDARDLSAAIKRPDRAQPNPRRKVLHEPRIVLRRHGMLPGREEAFRRLATIERRNLKCELQSEGRLS